MIYRVVMDGNDILDYDNKNTTLLNSQLNTELNTAGSMEFTMPPDHLAYSQVRPLLSTIEVYEDDDLLWFGRPVEIKTDFWNQRKVYCEGALSFFNDSVQRPHEYDRISLHAFFHAVIEAHNTQVASERQFTVGRITVADKTVYRMLRYESTFDVLKRQCLNAEGGYFFIRREEGVNYIDWLLEMPYSCNQPVEFGLNLLDITSGFDGSSIATCVLPLGDEGEDGEELTVASINGGSDVIESDAISVYGRITKAVTFPGVKEAGTLYADGVEYLESTQFNNLVIECSASELHSQNENYEKFRVGQVVHCHSVPHLLDRDLPLSKLSIQLDTAAKKITLGNIPRQTLTEIYKEDAEAAQERVLDVQGYDVEQIQGIVAELDDMFTELESLFEQLPEIGTGTEAEEAINETIDAIGENIDELENLVDGLEGVDTGTIDSIKESIDEIRENFNDLGEIVDNISGGGGGGSGADSTAVEEIRDGLSNLEENVGSFEELINGIVDGSNDGWGHWFGTQSEYEDLGTYDNHTIYFIKSSTMLPDYFIYSEGEL